jgi:hypothetical protein
MKRLRSSLLILLLISGVFLNIERIDIGNQADIVNIQSFVYFLAFFAVFSTFLIPDKIRPSALVLIGIWGVFYILCKLFIFTGRPFLGGIYTYLSVTEFSMLSLLIWSSGKVASELYDVEETVANVTLDDVSERVKKLDQAEDVISKEFARSRRHDTPISVMVLKVHPEDVEFNLQRSADEILKGMLKRYASNRLVRLLDRELRRTDLVIETFVLADRIRTIIKENIGINVSAGFASFPDEALTFDDLLKQAESQTQIPELQEKTQDIEEI